MKNAELKRKMDLYGIEWIEVARFLQVPLKDLTRRLNSKEVTPAFRRHILQAIKSISERPEDFYDEFR